MLKFITKTDRKKYSLYECSCGTRKEIRDDHVRYGYTQSCGCIKKTSAKESLEKARAANTKHGMAGSSIYNIWRSMKERCNNPNQKFYSYYGGRGISVCDRWNTFENFYADMGDRPPGMTIDRINGNLGYSPENCRWATRAEQQANLRVNRRIEYNGLNLTLSQWSRVIGVHRNTITERLNAGWDIEKVLSTDKHRDLSGLSLGGKANGKRQKSKTHCPKGHEYTPENTAPNGKNGRSCRRCHADRELARRKKHLKPLSSDPKGD